MQQQTAAATAPPKRTVPLAEHEKPGKKMKVRFTSPRAGDGEANSYKIGQAAMIPIEMAKKLLERGEAIPYNEGEPDYIPPDGVVLSQRRVDVAGAGNDVTFTPPKK